MTDPKNLFLKNKDLSGRWSAVAHADWFAEVLVYARASFLDSRITLSQEQLEGAKNYERILCDLCDAEGGGDTPLPSVGLHHDLDYPKPENKKTKD